MTPDQQQALDIQNKGRANKGIKPLQWDGNLRNKAQEWYVFSPMAISLSLWLRL